MTFEGLQFAESRRMPMARFDSERSLGVRESRQSQSGEADAQALARPLLAKVSIRSSRQYQQYESASTMDFDAIPEHEFIELGADCRPQGVGCTS